MLLQTTNQPLTMSSQEISDLVESRHDSVKRTMERLADKNLISITPMVEPQERGGKPVTYYHVNKRDSYIVVAQLSPEFTARLVDRWQELENQVKPKELSRMEILQLAMESEQAKINAEKERDEAIRTKAQINDKRTATLMNKASQDSKRIKSLEMKLQDVGLHKSIIAAGLPERIDTEFKLNVQTWRILKRISEEMGHEIIKVKDSRYGQVNTYHVDVIDKFMMDYM